MNHKNKENIDKELAINFILCYNAYVKKHVY